MTEEINEVDYAMKCQDVMTYVFPAQDSSTFDAINVPDGMVASRHLAVIWFAFYNINTGIGLVR
jgi:hypothetical protein